MIFAWMPPGVNHIFNAMKTFRTTPAFTLPTVAVSFCFSISFMVGAQNLPSLNQGVISNHGVSISWPYTNANFALQESAALVSPTNWQPSALTPIFDSNRAVFSVSAAVTNAACFFRLERPVDLRGIYIYSGDVTSLSVAESQTLSNSFSVPGVDGLVLVAAWNGIEPTNRIFHWKDLDSWMSNAVALGLKVDLVIPAGDSTPAWPFDPVVSNGAGATPLDFTISPHAGETSNCIPDEIAAPWDTNFLASWNNMLRVLADHLNTVGTYSNIVLVRLTGINRTTDELRLPAETPQSTGLDCVSNAPTIWQSAGYTPEKLLFGWSNILSSFETYFPDKNFCVAIIPQNAFPPIDDSTNLITQNIPDPSQPLLALASQNLPGRLVVQFNSLVTGSNATIEVPQSAQAYGTLAAYQSNNWNGKTNGGAACGGDAANPVACSNDTYLAEMETGIYPLTPTNALRSQYIEVFPANVIAFTNAIWQAHQELFAPQ
jgi:hypothetical protein